MKNLIVLILIAFTTSINSQNRFVYTEKGLNPKFSVSQIDSLSQIELYKKTIAWIDKTYTNPDKVIKTQIENDFIHLSGIKENAIKEGKSYFHLKYLIKINFNDGQYKFEPLDIKLKANSKYDMGWKDFNLKDGTLFFKKGKAIKRLKSYVNDIPSALNDLNINLLNFLTANNY